MRKLTLEYIKKKKRGTIMLSMHDSPKCGEWEVLCSNLNCTEDKVQFVFSFVSLLRDS